MTDRVLLCVDLSYQVYRACAAHPGLTSRRVFTGGLYGFLTAVAKAARETRATDVAWCRDSKPYVRSLAYPDYKQLRKSQMDPELKAKYEDSMPMVLGTLTRAGFAVWAVPGFESDDLIAHAALKYRHRFAEIFAMSNDSDLYQLFSRVSNFRVYRKSLADSMTRGLLLKETGCTPDQYCLATALAGTHNDVEGIRGVGAAKSRAAAKDPALLRPLMAQHGDLVRRNQALIALPHAEFPRGETLPQHNQRSLDARALHRDLMQVDINCTPQVEQALRQLLEGRA